MIKKTLQLFMIITVLTTSTFADKVDEIKKAEDNLAKMKLIKTFSESVKTENWETLISICSKKVKKACKDIENKNKFFNSVIPVQAINKTKNFPRSTYSNISIVNGVRKYERHETITINLSKKECSYSLSWKAKLQEEDGIWVMDFNTDPFTKQILLLQSKDKK